MEINRDTVLEWLTNERRSQSWLASQCEVSDQAVSNWLREKNARPISANAQIVIRSLMEEDAAKTQAKPLQNLVLEFSDEEYKAIGRAALMANQLVPDWTKAVLNSAANEDMEALAELVKRSGLHAVPGSGGKSPVAKAE